MAIDLKLNVIMKMPLSRRILILAAVHVLFIVLYYFFVFSPKNAEIATRLTKLEDVQKRVVSLRDINRKLPMYRKTKEELEAKLRKALTQLPNEKEIPSLIDNISRAGKESGLEILVFKPSGERAKGFYAEVPVSMKVNAEFKSFYTFCQKVGTMSRIVNIDNLSIVSKQDKGGSVVLRADFMATTFRFIPEGETKGRRGKKKRG
ncbi:MAG: type 4a pilus biogenesis protein PilO [Thermodesulfobacteriota bacterium]